MSIYRDIIGHHSFKNSIVSVHESLTMPLSMIDENGACRLSHLISFLIIEIYCQCIFHSYKIYTIMI